MPQSIHEYLEWKKQGRIKTVLLDEIGDKMKAGKIWGQTELVLANGVLEFPD